MNEKDLPGKQSLRKRIQSYVVPPYSVKKIFKAFSFLVLAGFTFILSLFLLTWSGMLGSLPDKIDLGEVKNPVASEVYSADSVLLGRYFIQERSDISFSDLPAHTVNALLATEDVRFYEHHGIDYRSLGRVLVKSLFLQDESSGGGSTLTQQLAKNLYPRKKYLFFSLVINKMRELIIATRLENAYNKEELITLYLNTIPFGDNTFGIQAAAQRFFSIPVSDLSIDQSAVLIGMLKATHSYNPRIYPDNSIRRRNTVLAQMVKYQFITTEQADTLRAKPLDLDYNKITHHSGLAPYFREYLRAELIAWCEKNKSDDEAINLYRDGLKIYTTIDSRLQRYAEEAMTKQMASLQKTFSQHWGKQEPWKDTPEMIDQAIRQSDRYRGLKKQKLSEEEIKKAMNEKVPMNIFTWKGERDTVMSSVDSIKHYLKFLNAGMLAMDPEQGAIRVWVGGINHHYFQYDHVKESTKRQVGSTFKPIVYAAALEQGAKPCTFISAEKTQYTNMEGWTPSNTSEDYKMKYSMTGALAYSINTVSVQLLEKAGIGNTISLAHKMGITSDLPAVPAIALGTPNISMMEMVSAYTTFANKGEVVKPFYLTSITDAQGNVLEEFKPAEKHRALSEESAQMILYMLKVGVNEGTSAGIRARYGLTNDMGGKTGTTQSNTDGWFIAVTPHLVMGAWVGADDPRVRFRSTALGQGSRTALPLIGNFMQRVNADKEFNELSHAQFDELSPSLARKVSCDLSKKDNNILRKVFARNRKEKKREFGEKKSGWFKRLLGKDK